MVLLCGASAVSAASDNTVDNLTSDTDDSFLVSNNLNAVGVDDSALNAQENDVNNNVVSGVKNSGNLQNLGDSANQENSRVIYVGQNITEDGGNGSYENPYSSLKLACDNVNGEGIVNVYLFNGTYYVGSELKFNTGNLNINALNGEVIIKNEKNVRCKQAIELTSADSNFTMNNIIFDGSGWTIAYTNNAFFTPFYGNANYGTYNNCTFIGSKRSGLVGENQFNAKFLNCIFKDYSDNMLFKNNLDGGKFIYFENDTFLLNGLSRNIAKSIYTNKNITLKNMWFGQNDIPDYLKEVGAYNPSGSSAGSRDIPVVRYAIFSVSENYLGNNLYEIIGKLCWNGTNDTVGGAFAPMTVTLTSASGEIQSNVTLENGVFRAVYTSNSSDNLVTATLDYETLNLNFTNVDFQVDAPSIFYGQDQNITITLPQASNATVNVTVNNKTYEVKFNDSSVVTFTVPEVLKEGTYPVEVLLNDNENHMFGFNSAELVVSKVSDYDFEVIPSTDVKVGDNVTITIALPDDVNGTVTVKFGNETQTLQANTTMTVTFNNLNATTYPINVTYGGNDKYTSKEAIDSVTVNKADSGLEIEDAVFTYGDVIAIPFNVTNANGITVSVLNKDDDEVATNSSESNIINLDTLPAGKYTLEATTIVGSNYEWVAKTINLTINKANSSIDIQDKEFVYADEAVISAVTENSTGDVIAKLTDENNTEMAVTVSGNDITLPKLNVGKYTLTVTTNVTDNYNDVTKSATITITKTTPSMNVIVKPTENITTIDNVTLTISLQSDATGEVTVKVNGKKTDTISANETITINLNNNVGDYVVDIAYSGDQNYESDMATKEFTISKAETSITAKQIAFEEGNASTIEVTIPDVNSGIVLVDVSGKKFYGDINNGKATVTLDGLSEGNYTANIKFFGDEKYKETTCTADVKVSEDKIITELKEQLEEANAKVDNLTGDLVEANAKVDNLTGELTNATDKIADLTAELNETQANATKLSEDLADAQANVTKLSDDLVEANAKVDNLTAELNETQANATKLSEDLADAQANVTKLSDDLADAQANVTKLSDDLADAQANVTKLSDDLADAQANVTSLANDLADAQANVTSLANDLADVNGKVDNLTAQLIEAEKQIETLSAELIPTTIAANNLKIKALTNGNIKVTLKANGTVLANKTVNVILNGVVYNGTTGEDGVAKIVVKFASAGTYYATVIFAGDDTYKSSISTSKVVVSKKATKITAPKKKFKAKTKIKKVKITLKSGSKVIKSKKITLKVNGKTYKAKTNSKGVATIKVTKLTKIGTFTYTVKFAGDKAYKAITKKGKMTIK